jgi:Tfp pilus assembly PilM family ATPase
VGMCLRYHASQHAGRRVDRVIFVGSEAKQRGLCQHIARTLKLPGNMADPLARLARTGTEPATGVDLRQPQPGWAVAMGLCMSPTDL